MSGRRRGLGQVMPTCASVDATQTVPQMVLMGGGSLALLVGVVGAVFSEDYRKEFAYAAGVGLLANVIGGIWAGSSAFSNIPSPQCTGPGLSALGIASVNPDPTTPTGQPAPGYAQAAANYAAYEMQTPAAQAAQAAVAGGTPYVAGPAQ